MLSNFDSKKIHLTIFKQTQLKPYDFVTSVGPNKMFNHVILTNYGGIFLHFTIQTIKCDYPEIVE